MTIIEQLKEKKMANYRGVDKSVLVETIENAMDYVLRQNFNMAAKRHFDAWIDGTKLNILKQPKNKNHFLILPMD